MWPFKRRENPNSMAMSSGAQEVRYARECTDCGCLVGQERGKTVEDHRLYALAPLLYCDGCAPSYDVVYTDSVGVVSFHKKVPEHMVLVTEKGKPIKAEGK